LLLSGCLTDGCVLWTAAYAMHEGYYPVILRDCVASFDATRHERTSAFMETKFPMYRLGEVLAAWGRA